MQSDVSQALKKTFSTASSAQMKGNYDSTFSRHQPEELSGEGWSVTACEKCWGRGTTAHNKQSIPACIASRQLLATLPFAGIKAFLPELQQTLNISCASTATKGFSRRVGNALFIVSYVYQPKIFLYLFTCEMEKICLIKCAVIMPLIELQQSPLWEKLVYKSSSVMKTTMKGPFVLSWSIQDSIALSALDIRDVSKCKCKM